MNGAFDKSPPSGGNNKEKDKMKNKGKKSKRVNIECVDDLIDALVDIEDNVNDKLYDLGVKQAVKVEQGVGLVNIKIDDKVMFSMNVTDASASSAFGALKSAIDRAKKSLMPKEESAKPKEAPAQKPAEAQPPPPAATNAPAKAEAKPAPANTPKPAAAKNPPAAKAAATNAPVKAKGPSPLRMASPREQMEQAIGRGDYAAAAKFAAPILRTNPDDAYANFAVGMDHFGKQAWDRAVTHLTRCVKQSPDEPVFLNNLAIALLYKGRYDEALKHAQKALKIQPDSEVVQDTINQIKKARADVAAKKPDSKKKPAGKKPQKKAEKTEEPPKPTESPAPADPPAQDDTEGLVPAAPSASEDM